MVEHTDDTLFLLDTHLPQDLEYVPINDSHFTEAEDEDWGNFSMLRGSELQVPPRSYVNDFRAAAEGKTMILGQVDVSQLEKQEAEIGESKRLVGVGDQAAFRKKYEELWDQHKKAKRSMTKSFQRREKELEQQKKTMKNAAERRSAKITDAFERVHKVLDDTVKTRKGESSTKMGGLNDQQNWLPSGKGKSKKVEVRMDLARCIKDKLPCAFFVVLITLWDRLGGNPIELSRKARVTHPKRHSGRFYNTTLRFEESLFLKVPSRLRAPMCISFELFILRNSQFPSDKVVAHGFFPLVDSDFELLRGKFKVPLLRGPIDKTVDKYSNLTGKMQEDLDSWLCNLYFQLYSEDPPNYLPLRLPEQYDEFAYSVTKPDGLKSQQASRRKLEYLVTEAAADLSASGLKHAELWVSVILLVLMAWSSRFTHYFGQWCYLQACSITVNQFAPVWLTFKLRYATDSGIGFRVGLILVGTLFSVCLFVILCGLSVLSIRKFGRFPNIIFRSLAYFGIMILLDWLFTLIESVMWGYLADEWAGDSFILYSFFDETEEVGAVGVILTFLLYCALSALAAFVLYNYFLKLHMHGRLLDLYLRLTASESAFFVPYDNEVSLKYLTWVVEKSLNYRSLQGVTRKLALSEYSLTESDNLKEEKKSKLAIFSEDATGKRALYRHFDRLPDGAFCELATPGRVN
jgi:hypothetical protein